MENKDKVHELIDLVEDADLEFVRELAVKCLYELELFHRPKRVLPRLSSDGSSSESVPSSSEEEDLGVAMDRIASERGI